MQKTIGLFLGTAEVITFFCRIYSSIVRDRSNFVFITPSEYSFPYNRLYFVFFRTPPCTIPIPYFPAAVERVFSKVHLNVTIHRNRLKVNTTNVLLMVSINNESIDSLDLKAVVDLYLSKKSRRICNQ